MSSYTANKYADMLYQMSQKDQGPFPYEDCRKILREAGNALYDDLIPDLSAYFYEIYSHSAGAKNLIGWSSVELTRSQKIFRKSFFARQPKYASIESMINQDNTPTLVQRMGLYEQMRLSLTKLITSLIEDQRLLNTSQKKLLEAHH
jgi:predicted patatin/cPLA2 family phospholipase